MIGFGEPVVTAGSPQDDKNTNAEEGVKQKKSSSRRSGDQHVRDDSFEIEQKRSAGLKHRT